jgi:hypothetical protein
MRSETTLTPAVALGLELLSDVREADGAYAEIDLMIALQTFYAAARDDITRDEAILLFAAPSQWRCVRCEAVEA